MEMQHFSHDHPLIPDPSIKEGFEGLCRACVSHISRNAPSYGCVQCKFYLHEYCARLPLQIQHSEHPQDPLFLSHPSEKSRCCNCGRTCTGFTYRCFRHKFYLDVECALKDLNPDQTFSFLYEGHSLVLSYQPALHDHRCFVCENILDLPVFKCKDYGCIYKIHLHCAPLKFPSTIQHKHIHPLMFREKFIEDDSGEYYCDACEERRHPDHPLYYCIQCSSASAPYTAHMACVLSHEVLHSLAQEYESSERVQSLTLHHHRLIIKKYPRKLVVKCIVCKSNLVDTCLLCNFECGFNLHYSCRKLEIEINHPIHLEHSLTLHVDATKIGPFFQCYACKEMCLCVIYRCSLCNFNICVRCIRSVQNTTMFEYQNHKLFLFNFDVGDGKCDYCGSNKTSHRFICMEGGCTYNLHFLCAPFSFPETVEHKDHEHCHQLSLKKYSGIDLFKFLSRDRNCYICHGFLRADDPCYSCKQCNETAHASCALLEILPQLIAKFNNSTVEEKLTRLKAELEKLKLDKLDMKAQLKAIESQMMEKNDQLKQKSKSIEAKEAAILKLEGLQSASSE